MTNHYSAGPHQNRSNLESAGSRENPPGLNARLLINSIEKIKTIDKPIDCFYFMIIEIIISIYSKMQKRKGTCFEGIGVSFIFIGVFRIKNNS